MANTDTDLRCYLTNAGIAAENNAIQLGRKLPIKEMVFGSGVLADSKDPRNQTTMISEQFKVPCAMITHSDNSTLLTFKGDIPVDVGGFNINEVAIRLEDDTIYGYARGTGDYKPTPEQGATESIRYVVDMYSTNVTVIECKVDLSNVYADYEDLERVSGELSGRIKEHESNPNPHDQYATKDSLSELINSSQFLLYSPTRIYKVGEICYTTDQSTGELSYWQWYSNVESLAGKSPLLLEHRHIAWTDNTKPFYWVSYTGDQVGMPFYWLDTSAPEWAVMEINVDLPIAVYWRLARRYPHLVSGDTINTGEIRGEFLRVLDQGRGVDSGRQIGSYQSDEFKSHYHTLPKVGFSHSSYNGIQDPNCFLAANNDTGRFTAQGKFLDETEFSGGSETRSRNIARPMVIAI